MDISWSWSRCFCLVDTWNRHSSALCPAQVYFNTKASVFWEYLRSVSAGLGTLKREWFIQWLSSIIKASLVTSCWWLTDPQIHDDYKKKAFSRRSGLWKSPPVTYTSLFVQAVEESWVLLQSRLSLKAQWADAGLGDWDSFSINEDYLHVCLDSYRNEEKSICCSLRNTLFSFFLLPVLMELLHTGIKHKCVSRCTTINSL